MKTIIIGGRGLIAPYLIKKLKSLKHEVTVLHHGDPIEIKEADYIFYIASFGNHYHQKDAQMILKANVIDYINLLRKTQDVQYKALFYFSSSSVTLPVQTDYSDAKYIGEIISKRFFKKFKKPIICIRPSSVYGIGEAPFRLMPVAINNVLDGKDMPMTEGYHDWIYVEDFADGLIEIMKNSQRFLGKSVPIGTGIQTSNHQILGMVMKIAGKSIKLVESETVKRNYDIKNWVADTTILKSLGFEPKYTVEKGLEKMIKHYVAERLKKKNP